MVTMQTEASLLTKQEVADRLKVSVRTVERMEAAGDLVAVRFGRAVRFRSEDVRDALGHRANPGRGRAAVPRIPSVAESPTLDIPPAGECLGLNRIAAYRAAKDGHLPTVQISERRYKVPTAALRTMLGLPVDGPAIELGTTGAGAA